MTKVTNDLCVLNRDPGSAPDFLKALPDCPKPSSLPVGPGPYNLAPFLFWGGLLALIVIAIVTVVIYIVRANTRKDLGQQMMREGMPQVRKDIQSLQSHLGQVESMKNIDDRLEKIEAFFGGKL